MQPTGSPLIDEVTTCARAARGIAPPRFILTATIDQTERLVAPEPGRNVLVELVVDRGRHTKGWTRKQAIDCGISASEVERYVADPGQACAYMIGQLKILELRDKTRRELGDKFSLKEFHNVILRTGMVPLEVVEEVVDEYIATKKQP